MRKGVGGGWGEHFYPSIAQPQGPPESPSPPQNKQALLHPNKHDQTARLQTHRDASGGAEGKVCAAAPSAPPGTARLQMRLEMASHESRLRYLLSWHLIAAPDGKRTILLNVSRLLSVFLRGGFGVDFLSKCADTF